VPKTRNQFMRSSERANGGGNWYCPPFSGEGTAAAEQSHRSHSFPKNHEAMMTYILSRPNPTTAEAGPICEGQGRCGSKRPAPPLAYAYTACCGTCSSLTTLPGVQFHTLLCRMTQRQCRLQ
jgi:hypothetical protein